MLRIFWFTENIPPLYPSTSLPAFVFGVDQPSDIHERIPTFLGSVEDVLELESYGDVQQLGIKKYAF